MSDSVSPQGQHLRSALGLCLLAVVGYMLTFGTGVFLARVLGPERFGDFNLAVAALALLASLTTLGLEKLGLRELSAYYETRDWARARGFLFFGWRAVLVVSAIVAAAYVATHVVISISSGSDPHPPLVFAVLLLPVVALVLFLIEVATVNGQALKATAIYRVLSPAVMVAAIGALVWAKVGISASLAVLCYGAGWMTALFTVGRLARRTTPLEVWPAESQYERPRWIRLSVLFLIHGLMMTQFATLGIVGLELVNDDEMAVGIYAACLQAGGFVILLATSTNRFYAPIMAVLIERRDYDGMRKLIKQRWAWLVPVTLVYLAVMVLWGRQILALFGPEFKAGYPALCAITAGASVSVLFAGAPYYLKFIDRNRLVLGVTAAAAVLNVALLVPLGHRHGATGAALAYGLSLAAMAIAFYFFGVGHVRHAQSMQVDEEGSRS